MFIGLPCRGASVELCGGPQPGDQVGEKPGTVRLELWSTGPRFLFQVYWGRLAGPTAEIRARGQEWPPHGTVWLRMSMPVANANLGVGAGCRGWRSSPLFPGACEE